MGAARVVAGVALAASMVAVGGCASARVPAPLSAVEVEEYERQHADQLWQSTGLDESLRPAVELIVFVDADDQPDLFNECVNERLTGELTEAEFGIALYVCDQTYPLAPKDRGYFSADQNQAIYDYFQKTLVPCYEAHGAQIAFAPPRQEHIDTGYLIWHPLWTIDSQEVANRLQRECGFLPEWAMGSR